MGFKLFNPLGLGMLGKFTQSGGEQTLAGIVAAAGGVMYLDVRKADGELPLTGNDTPFVDISGSEIDITLINEMTDGDFSDGTAHLIDVNSDSVVVGGVMTNTGDGGSATPYTRIDTDATISGHKYFRYVKVKVTNSVAVEIQARIFDMDVTDYQQATPAINTDYALCGFSTATDVNGDIYLQHEYADAGTANGKEMVVDGANGVFLIDLTLCGCETMTKQELIRQIEEGFFDSKNLVHGHDADLLEDDNYSWAGDGTSGFQAETLYDTASLRFDGSDNLAVIMDHAGIDITDEDFAIGITFVPRPVASGYVMAKNDTTELGMQYGLYASNSSKVMRLFLNGSNEAEVDFVDNQVVNILFVKIGTTIYPYLDGVAETPVTGYSGGDLVTKPNFQLGGYKTTSVWYAELRAFDLKTFTIYKDVTDKDDVRDAEIAISAEFLDFVSAAIWDGSYRDASYVSSGGSSATVNDTSFPNVHSILIDVSGLSAGQQIKVTHNAPNASKFRFAGLSETIAEIEPDDGAKVSYTPIGGSFSELSVDSTPPFEYTYTIVAGTNTVIWYFDTTLNESVASVEVI